MKTLIRNLGSNVHKSSVVRASKSLGVVHHIICELFESETRKKKADSHHHPFPEIKKDFELLLSVLEGEKVFSIIPGRKHSSFKHTKGVIESFDKDKYLEWIKYHLVSNH